MATTTLVVTIVSLLFASTLTCHGVSAANVAQSPAPVTADAPVPAPDVCFTAITNMSDCLTFVEDGSKLTKPDKGCCPELAGLVDGNPACLCHLLGNSESIIGIKINVNKALKLPTVCKVTTPDISLCSGKNLNAFIIMSFTLCLNLKKCAIRLIPLISRSWIGMVYINIPLIW
jgi:hypothetical protein